MVFIFAYCQYDRCNTGQTASVEGCDFSNGKNREALNWFFAGGAERNARNANFSGINFLADTDITEFSGRDFTGSDFSGSVLPNIAGNNNFTDADFSGAIHSGDFEGGNIYSNATFDGATLEGDFEGATLTNASFVSTIFDNIYFNNCYMEGSTFKDVRGYGLKFYQSSLERITIEDSRLFEIEIVNTADQPASMIDAKLINANIVFPEHGIYDGIVSSNLVENECCLQEPWIIEDGVLFNFLSLNGTNSKDSAGTYSDKSSKGHDYYSVDADRDGCISLIEFNRFYKKIK